MGKKSEQGASPQLKDRYTRIANELLEALFRTPLSGPAEDVVLAIIRETYGYQVKSWPISEGRLAKITGIARANVHRALCELEQKNIIESLGTAKELGLVRQKGERGFDPRSKVWGIQKDYMKWKAYRQVAIGEIAMLLSEGQQLRTHPDSNIGVHKKSKRKVKGESPFPKEEELTDVLSDCMGRLRKICARRGDKLGRAITSRDAKDLKAMLEDGYSPEEIFECYEEKLDRRSNQGRHVPLDWVRRDIEYWLQERGPTTQETLSRLPDLLAKEE